MTFVFKFSIFLFLRIIIILQKWPISTAFTVSTAFFGGVVVQYYKYCKSSINVENVEKGANATEVMSDTSNKTTKMTYGWDGVISVSR